MRLTLIALLLAGVVGCDSTPEEPVPVDSETALVDAAEQGDAEAQYKLGFMYEGSDSVPEDCTEAAKWYRKAAEQGHVEAQYSLGFAYYSGEGVPKDYAESAKWFRKAAEQGHAEAQYNLGVMYDSGDGVPKDDVEAYAWLSLSVAQTNGDEDLKEELEKGLPELKAALTPEQLAAAEKRIEELTEQINANKAK